MSEVKKAKQSRGIAKGNITKRSNELRALIESADNLDTVKEKYAELECALHKFIQVNLDYVNLLEDEDKEEAEIYCKSVEDNTQVFAKKIAAWIKSIESSADDEDVQPDDSASQCPSNGSKLSTTSSARVRAAAKKAALVAQAECLKKRQMLEEQEFRIQQEKEELAMRMMIAMAEAEEKVYTLVEAGENPNPNSSDNSQNDSTSVPEQANDTDASPLFTTDAGPAPGTTHKIETTTSAESVDKMADSASLKGDQVNESTTSEGAVLKLIKQGQEQQQRLMDSIQMPRAELMTYDGDPLKYWVFIRSFDNSVGNTCLDDNAKLTRLIQYCSGKAKGVIQCCFVMNPNEGYKRARELLQERFGNNHVIAETWVEKITQGRSIAPGDKHGIREFSDELIMCHETLKAMGYVNEMNTQKTLVTIAERLPHYLRSRWVRQVWDIRHNQNKTPEISDLVLFVKKVAEEANDPVYGGLSKPNKEVQVTHAKDGWSQRGRNSQRTAKGSFTVSTGGFEKPNVTCILCHGAHSLFGCALFKSKKPEDRLQFAKETKLCFNCLNPGHMSTRCTLNRTCSVAGCGRKHTKFLHIPAPVSRSSGMWQTDVTPAAQAVQQVQNGFMGADGSCNLTGAGAMRVALPIVPVEVCAADGNISVSTYALLDSGSSSTFCSEELVRQLRTTGKSKELSLTTIEKANSRSSTMVVNLKVRAVTGSEVIDLPQVYTRPALPIHPDHLARAEDISKWPHLKDVDLPNVDKKKIGLLIGQDVPEALVPIEVRKGERGAPYATRTQLGWALNGPISTTTSLCLSQATSSFVTKDELLSEQLQKFWKLDTSDALVDDAKAMSVNDRRALAIWENTICHDEGHYEMAIPFKGRPPNLHDNRMMAENRLRSLGKRLQKDQQLLSHYRKEMNSLVQDGYAEAVDEDQPSAGATWYLPHHPVLNPKKPDKLRIVFDCAAKHEGVSLNDVVLQGPDLTNKLMGVLMRFRQEPVALMGDIQAMFHQVRVTPDDRDVLRYLWWPDGDMARSPVTYRMKVHLFGGTWSPSCCSFALRRTAEDNEAFFHADTVKTVMRDFYVDDCLKSVSSDDKGIVLVKELRGLLSRGGFRLTKWVSNSPRVLDSIPVEERVKELKSLDLNYEAMPTERALGMNWDVELDCFTYKMVTKDKPMTRRGLLSVVSSIYDPHGFVSPWVLKAKMIIQDLSRRKLGWDDPLPGEHVNSWLQFKHEMPQMEQFKVNRCIKPYGFGEVIRSELHHFSDASETAYGAVSYLRTINSEAEVHTCLVMAKSHLAPLKQMTIPRLELMGATVSVKLDGMIRRELDLPLDESVFWTDSTIVLQYIKNEDKRFHTFVANRVSTIHRGSSPQQWRHVDSKLNPADDVSRGLSAEALVDNDQWLHGPSFLQREAKYWPETPVLTNIQDTDPEIKCDKEVVTIYVTDNSESTSTVDTGKYIRSHWSWYRLKKNVAWLLRVKKCLQAKAKKRQFDVLSPLTVGEMVIAEECIIKHVQRESFKEEFGCLLGTEGHVKKTSPLFKLDPIIKSDVIRVGGRLKNCPVSSSIRHPAVLPKNCHVAELIIRHVHETSGHSGREHVLALLRERFWLIGARTSIREILRDCFTCKRQHAKPVVQKMADLPHDRVEPDKPPFTYVGVDCFGPFMVKQGRSLVKRYGCIFTCLTIRAVHIEILHSLETDSFLNALQRFISRRGQPDQIRSDNGTNFVGADRELRETIQSWNQQKIHDYLLQREILWKFNPPSASHMGGVWERQIRTTRKIMNALMKEQTMQDEGLSTLMCLVEAIINSRPITCVSDDIRDPEPLTPNHLLLLRSGSVMPTNVFCKKDLYGRKRWRQVQYLASIFWRRWVREYLPTLQQRQKWLTPQRNISIGDLVLVVDDDLPRNKWLMGRVVEIHPGSDQLVRSARVKVRSTILSRPARKLCLLETVERAEMV